MNHYKLISVIFITSFASFAHFTIPHMMAESVETIIYQQDIPCILRYANKNAADEQAIADAFCNYINLNEYSYEQLKSWQTISQTPIVSEILQNALKQKEIDILNEVQSLTIEQLGTYTIRFPDRKDIVNKFVCNVLLSNLKDLSVFELIYLDACLPNSYHENISHEIKSRAAEISSTLSNNSKDYHTFEKQLAVRLKYKIEYVLWTYFVEGNKELNNAYSQISIVSDDPYTASEQYQRLVKMCFPAGLIRQALQNEVDQFCSEINRARKDYYKAMGKDGYTNFSYKVPKFVYNSTVPIEPLYKISEARETFVRNREDISTGTSVLGWLFGPVTGLISQGLGDMFAVDGLVDSEYEARKAYMESVQRNMLSNFTKYAKTVISGLAM